MEFKKEDSVNLLDLYNDLCNELKRSSNSKQSQRVLEIATIVFFKKHDDLDVSLLFLGDLVVPAYYKWVAHTIEEYAKNPVGEISLDAKVYFDEAKSMCITVNYSEIEKIFDVIRKHIEEDNLWQTYKIEYETYYKTFKDYEKALEDAFLINEDEPEITTEQTPVAPTKKNVQNKAKTSNNSINSKKQPKIKGKNKTKNSMYGGLVAFNVWFIILFVAMLALGGGLVYVNHLFATDTNFAAEFLPLINKFLNTIANVEYTAAQLPAKLIESAISAFVSAGCLAVAVVIIELLKSKIDVVDGLGVALFGVVLLLISFAKLPISTIICAVVFNKIAKNNIGVNRIARIILAVALPIAVMCASLVVFPI